MDTRELDLLIELKAGQKSGRNRRVREVLDLSQGWMGKQIGVAAVTVCTYESGRRTPRGPIAIAYAKLLRELERRATQAGIDLSGDAPQESATAEDNHAEVAPMDIGYAAPGSAVAGAAP